MTIAQYYTPGGQAVHKIGIEPDYEVPLPEGDNGMYDFADLEHDIQLRKAVEVMKERGVSPLYLLTDHTGFYERYGWEYLCDVQGNDEDHLSRMYVHY